MNSKKVKEIKKALEERTQHKPINCSHSEYVEACGIYCSHHREFVADMEIKNGQTCENCNKFTATYKVKKDADILTLIKELEKKKTEQLKQFAERLKEKGKEIVTGESVDFLVELLRYSEELVKEYTNENGKV